MRSDQYSFIRATWPGSPRWSTITIVTWQASPAISLKRTTFSRVRSKGSL